MRGQAAVEYMLLFGILLAFLVPVFVYSTQGSLLSIRTARMQEALRALDVAADELEKMGGGQITVFITLPEGIEGYSIENNTVKYTVRSDGSTSDAFFILKNNIIGKLPTEQGGHEINIAKLPNGTFSFQPEDKSPPIILATQPSGTIPDTQPTLKVVTNEDAICRYCSALSCTAATSYADMPFVMDGSGTSHQSIVGPLANGTYTYYTRCNDTAGNVMQSSSAIQFTVDTTLPDTQAPTVNGTGVSLTEIFVNGFVCINATVTDNVQVDKSWLLITDPFGNQYNYNMSSTSVCSSSSSNYGISLQLNTTGNWTVKTVFANDTSSNQGFQDPYPNIKINVISPPGVTLGDIGLDDAWYFKTQSDITDPDTGMKEFTNIIAAFKDSNSNTPSATNVIRRSNEGYEGFVIKVNNDTNQFTIVRASFFITSLDVSPYPFRIYAYLNATHINASAFVDATATSNDVSKWFEVDVTNIVKTEKGRGYMRLRATAQPTTQSNNKARFSEAKYRGG